jgi:hypothetical protein
MPCPSSEPDPNPPRVLAEPRSTRRAHRARLAFCAMIGAGCTGAAVQW